MAGTLVCSGQTELIVHSVNGVLQADHFEGDIVGNPPSQWTTNGTPVVQDFGSVGIDAQSGGGVGPGPVEFSEVVLADTASLCFTSEVGVVYLLEATTDLVSSSNWESVGAQITGTGTNTYLFDPAEAAGVSTSKAYRIVEAP